MGDYRRKKKDGKRYGSGGKIANYRRRPYTTRLGGLGGGGSYSVPRNYYRSHDFRYDRETETKPPKVETHYTIERPTETYRHPAYRPELDQAAVEKIVGQTIDRYRRNDPEREELETDNLPQRHGEPEMPIDARENNIEAKSAAEVGLYTVEMPSEINLDVPAQAFCEATLIETPANETYELPTADLELLLIELDANPAELQQEKIAETEGAVEQ